jgi:protease-4
MTENQTVEKYSGPAPQTIRIEVAGGDEKKRSTLGKILRKLIYVVLLISILLNVYFGLMLRGLFEGPFVATVLVESDSNDIVAVYPINGVIDGEQSAMMDRFYRFMRQNGNIKAVVLRVSSPGGTINDSERIYQTILRIQNHLQKPVAVYMDGVAASGGYYVAAPADRIFARRTTITGSIGVLAMYPVLKGMAEKLGVDVVTIRSPQATRWKARPNFLEEPEDRILLDVQQMLAQHQEDFNQVVKTHRSVKMIEHEVEIENAAGKMVRITEVEPFNGKVYLADKALEMGLVDEVGQQHDAVDWLIERAGLKDPKVIMYSRRASLAEALGIPFASTRVDENLLENVTSLRMLMLWKVD